MHAMKASRGAELYLLLYLTTVLNVGQPSPVTALRRRSAAERLLGSWFRIPPGAWMFVSCECLCCQVEVSATGRSFVQRSPTDCGVCLSVCSLETSKKEAA